MIKEISKIRDGQTIFYNIHCDSCHTFIAMCKDWKYVEGQELQYSSILCEKCGREHNKFVGDTVRENEELKKKYD